ncbi:MAG TPA: acyl-CoA thioesterase, partial [Arachidicoccus sp.]|nr:acyl-CoA thioesterase [Arachidicoccus sp.]
MKSNQLSFQFISEPSDVNFGGKVHGGVVMKWIDQTAYACACNWAGVYCVTVYVGGIRFYKPIQIGDIVKVEARIIYTGRTSMHIAVDVKSKQVTKSRFAKTTHCIIVFVAVDDTGKPIPVPSWIPESETEKSIEQYAKKLMVL